MNRHRLAGIGAITVTSILWGTTGTAATLAPGVGPLAIGSAALGIGGILQAVIAIPALRAALPAVRGNLRLIVLGAVAVMIYPLAFYSSMHFAGVAIGSVVSLASAPLASGLLEFLLEHKRLSRWWALAAGLGIIGSTLLCLSKMTDAAESAGQTVAGISLGLLAGATYATYSWAAHRLMNRGISRAASMGFVFGLGGTLLLPVLIVTGAPLLASTQAFSVAAYMAIIPMFLGYLLFGYGLTRVSASTATTITLTEPAIAAILAVLIVGERLTTLGWVGLAVIAGVLAILAIAPANEVERKTATSTQRIPAATR
ncbi:DMT family transporter [Cryobacterium sp. Hh38]|uniref:DMT family transporter n=1 Tax=Cryobacterium sp. Hh38 TaxID=1259156 RepID=UPI00106960CE|nr:EamA family transporter [Cryobacterium sp. Hh38]TFD56672.1 EamA/RhaT family transporter [Cryobacterium sp. Hh38]